MAELERGAYQELRLAMVFNGGVSLAVWMGGVAKELDRFRTAFCRGDPASLPYRELLDVVRTEMRTDVIAGTSAGGINGALLGYAVARGTTLDTVGGAAGEDAIRDLWLHLGAIDELLQVEEPGPDSALNHKALFRGCAKVFETLTHRDPLDSSLPARVRLTVTATDSAGYPVEVDGVDGRDHRLEMRFRAVTYPTGNEIRLSPALRAAIAAAVGEDRGGEWPFPPPSVSGRDLRGPEAPALLTRAARTTASFPIAFAPSTLPLAAGTPVIDGDPSGLTATPSMRDVLSTRGNDEALSHSANRYAVDGGLWDNAPFEAVLRAIDREPAGRGVDRRLVYVIYTAADPVSPATRAAAPVDEPPALIPSVLDALTAPSNVSFADDLERIAHDTQRQHARQERFRWLIKDGKPDLFTVAAQLLPVYKVRVAPTVVVPDVLLATATPLEQLSLADWHATADDWAWDTRPVEVALEFGRRLLGALLRGTAVDPVAYEQQITTLIRARDALSQLAWALSDLADRRDAPRTLTAAESRVCGQAMTDFAALMHELHEGVLAEMPQIETAPDDTDPSEVALGLSAGGPDTVIKRAIAAEIAMHALTDDDRKHKVDYAFRTIRPSTDWPLIAEVGRTPTPRPPLAGLADKHFGGFLLASWRLNDWMWGRLDASTQIVDMLLDRAQIQRLTAGRSNALQTLATQLAGLVIPFDGVDATRLRYLTYCAFASHPELANDADRPRDPTDDPAAPTADQLARWRARLADIYTGILTSALADPAAPGLDSLCADIRRRIQYAILDDERPGLVAQITADWHSRELHLADIGGAPQLDEATLSAEHDGGLRHITEAAAKMIPPLVLASYAEQAAANTLDAVGLKAPAKLVRAAEKATSATEALGHFTGVAEHYIGFRHRTHGDE